MQLRQRINRKPMIDDLPQEVIDIIEPKQPKVIRRQEPQVSTKRAPNLYVQFVRISFPIVKAAHPELSPQNILKLIAKYWRMNQ